MESKQKKILKVLALCLFFSIPLCILRVFVLKKSVSPESGFFTANPIFAIIYNVYFVVFVIAVFLIYKSILSKENKKKVVRKTEISDDEPLFETESNVLTYDEDEYEKTGNPVEDGYENKGAVKAAGAWKGTFSACFQLFFGFAFILTAVFRLPAIFNLIKYSKPFSDWISFDVFLLITAVISGLYYILSAFKVLDFNEKKHFFFSFFPIIFFATRLIYEYRDITKYINRNIYFANAVFVIFALVFIMETMQLFTGFDGFYKPFSYALSAYMVIFSGVSARIPEFVFRFLSPVSGGQEDIATAILDVAMIFFAISKLMILSDKKVNLAIAKTESQLLLEGNTVEHPIGTLPEKSEEPDSENTDDAYTFEADDTENENQ